MSKKRLTQLLPIQVACNWCVGCWLQACGLRASYAWAHCSSSCALGFLGVHLDVFINTQGLHMWLTMCALIPAYYGVRLLLLICPACYFMWEMVLHVRVSFLAHVVVPPHVPKDGHM